MKHIKTSGLVHLILAVSIMALFGGCGGGGGGGSKGGGSSDATAPVPGTGPTFADVSSYSLTVNWAAAEDNKTAQADLEYMVYYSTDAGVLTTAANAVANGIPAMDDWEKDITSKTVEDLHGSVTYHFSVVVRDAAGNMGLYAQQPQATDAATWKTPYATGFTIGTAAWISLKVDQDDVPYMAYSDGDNGGKLTVDKFYGAGWVTVGTNGEGLSGDGQAVMYVSLVLDNEGTPYVAYPDYDSENDGTKLTVMKYDSGSDAWVLVGSQRFSEGDARYVSLCIDDHVPGVHTPYVAFQDSAVSETGFPIVVMKYTGAGITGWVYVGSDTGLTTNSSNWSSLYIDSNGTPVVAYSDGDPGNNGKATVRVFNSNTNIWDLVGLAGFSSGLAYDLSLCLDGNGDEYLAYCDDSLVNKVVLMKHTGAGASGWTELGSDARLTSGDAAFSSLDIDEDNVPYVAYCDEANGNKLTVAEFSGGSWHLVGGSAGVSAGTASFVSLCLDQLGNPVVGYSDGNSAGKATVLKFY